MKHCRTSPELLISSFIGMGFDETSNMSPLASYSRGYTQRELWAKRPILLTLFPDLAFIPSELCIKSKSQASDLLSQSVVLHLRFS